MARRRRGEGSYYTTSSGRHVFAYWEVRPDGTRRRCTLSAADRDSLEQRVEARARALAAGLEAGAENRTVAEQLDVLLRQRRSLVRPKTLEFYTFMVERIRKHLGGRLLRALVPTDVEAMREAILSSGESRRTAAGSRQVLGSALKLAQRDGLIERNVAQLSASGGDSVSTEMLVWSRRQTLRFLRRVHKAKHPRRALFVLALYTGMRIGEMLGLQWSRVDLEHGRIKIDAALSPFDVPELVAPKTKHAIRTIDVPGCVVRSLTRHRTEQKEWRLKAGDRWNEEFKLVFSTRYGTPIMRPQIRREFRAAAKAALVPIIRVHDLRHTHATLALESGESPATVQKRLGHANVGITLGIYNHVSAKSRKKASNKFARYLNAPRRKLADKLLSAEPGEKESGA